MKREDVTVYPPGYDTAVGCIIGASILVIVFFLAWILGILYLFGVFT